MKYGLMAILLSAGLVCGLPALASGEGQIIGNYLLETGEIEERTLGAGDAMLYGFTVYPTIDGESTMSVEDDFFGPYKTVTQEVRLRARADDIGDIIAHYGAEAAGLGYVEDAEAYWSVDGREIRAWAAASETGFPRFGIQVDHNHTDIYNVRLHISTPIEIEQPEIKY